MTTTSDPNVITDFSGDYDFLHNAYPALVFVDNEAYPSVEHAFQASKTDDVDLRKQIREASDIRAVKKIGRKVVLKDNWDDIKYDVMRELIMQKFITHLDLKIKLLLTLYCGFKTYQDTFWGVDANGAGENNLGVILFSVREDIRRIEGSAWQVFMKFLNDKNLGFVEKELSDVFFNDSTTSQFLRWS